jgi:hypothetical protein
MLGFDLYNSANGIVLLGAAAAVILTALRASFKILRFFQRLDCTMAFVERELKPNGGGSMRDAIDKLVHRTQSLEAIVLPPSKENP